MEDSKRSTQMPCQHIGLSMASSPYASASGFKTYSHEQVLTAMDGKRKHDNDAVAKHFLPAFPAPLVLPGDCIDIDTRYPPQSFSTWLKSEHRSRVTAERSVIYVAAPPKVCTRVHFMREWQRPSLNTAKQHQALAIDTAGITSYLAAFYHGLEVRMLPTKLEFVLWEDDSPVRRSKSSCKSRTNLKHDVPRTIALSTESEAIQIRTRSAPTANAGDCIFPYSHQLDLNDLIDVGLSVLPDDAYSLLLLSDHDLFESEDDDFCCGRAFGASRVAVVSGARYQPCLDNLHGIDREHVWPMSHCNEFLRNPGADATADARRARVNGHKRSRTAIAPPQQHEQTVALSPLEQAVKADRGSDRPAILTSEDLHTTFLLRLCRTASHELGHCFGLDHCMYRACAMQGTASIAEDMRQPPYLCPVCEAKLSCTLTPPAANPSTNLVRNGKARKRTTCEYAAPSDSDRTTWQRSRLVAINGFCEARGGAFNALLAWSRAFLDKM